MIEREYGWTWWSVDMVEHGHERIEWNIDMVKR